MPPSLAAYAYGLITSAPRKQGRVDLKSFVQTARNDEADVRRLALPVFLPEALAARIALWRRAGMLKVEDLRALTHACAIIRRHCGENLRDEALRALAAERAASMRAAIAENKRRRIAERRDNARRASSERKRRLKEANES